MGLYRVVFAKEIRDNFRDRRSFFFAVVYGPILMPLLMLIPMILGVNSSWVDYEKTTEVYVRGAEHAPNLVQFLKNHNLEAVEAPADFKAKVVERELHVVLEVTPAFGAKLRNGERAPLSLYLNQSSKKSQSAAAHLRNVLRGYDRQLGYLRLVAQGLDTNIHSPIHLSETDLSKEGLSGLVLGFFVYFVLVFSMMTGGFYLAVDSTAGERERNSLEPLLSLPISRSEILFGKWLAVLLFVVFSSCVAMLVTYLTLTFVPSGAAAELFNVSVSALFVSFLIAFPCAILITSVLIFIAAFTRSTKEAQTYISSMYLIPMAPALLGQFMDIKPYLGFYAVPFFSQYQIINKILKDELILASQVGFSVLGALAIAALLLWMAIRLYRRDRILA